MTISITDVVGPRRRLPREVMNYDGDVERRLLVKSGGTRLWHGCGCSDLPWDESVRLEASNVDNCSTADDFPFTARALKAGFASDGAH
jgi:lipopolysaccharide/colanic/teichoic acid biosynthesis glycosyltransferase